MTESGEGLRERKRKETLRRITEAGLKLFSSQGYEETTLDAIAAEAGISRRTFFHYFASKDDILLSLQTGLGESVVAALQDQDTARPPLAVLREVMIVLAASYPPEELRRIDRFMLASEGVQARKQANYLKDEALLFSALCALWPDEDETQLRLLSALAISVTRLSLDIWRQGGGVRPIADVTREIFDALAALPRQG